MKSLWLENKVLSYRSTAPVPIPAPGEARLRVRTAGVCSTDLEMVKGYYPFTGVPGHEFVAVVDQVNPSTPGDQEWLGTRVVGEINASCWECEACRAGRPTHCERRTVLGISRRDGIFAEYAILPLVNLHLVPDGLSDEMAVFTEPLAAALEIQEQVQIKPDDRVLVIGSGRLGQLIAQTLALTGCSLKVLARRPRQMELLRARGIDVISAPEIAPGRFDIVVEATGSPQGFDLARKAVRTRGTIVLKSTYAGDLTVNMSGVVVDEITLLGSRCGPFAPALRLLDQGRVDVLPLIEARYPLEQGLQAFEHAAAPGVLKVLIEI